MTDPETHSPTALANPLLHVLGTVKVIRQFWVTFLSVAMICIGGTWYVASSYYSSHYSQQIDIVKSNNSYLQDRLRGMTESTPPSQWRRLSDSARAQILASVKAMPSPPKMIVIYAVAETESRQYASQFADAFRSIGIDVQPREISASMFSSPEIGLMIGITTFPNPSPEATKFKEILTKAGLDVHHVAWGGEEIDGVKPEYDLYVGSKPW
jgi:hypothetical protein